MSIHHADRRCAWTAPVTLSSCSSGMVNTGMALYFHSIRVSRRGTIIRYCMCRISRLVRCKINLIHAWGGSIVSAILPVRGASKRDPKQRMLSGIKGRPLRLWCVYMFRCASGSLRGRVITTVLHINRFCFGGRLCKDKPHIRGY